MKGKASAEEAGTRSSQAVTVLMETRSDWQRDCVKEIYHPDYVAKRMEIGAVMGAAPRRAVIRETSDPGDVNHPSGRTNRKRRLWRRHRILKSTYRGIH